MHHPEAEMAVLGSCLTGDPEALVKALSILQPEHFESGRHRDLFRLVGDLHREGKPVDSVTVIGMVEPKEKSYIFELTNAVPSALHVEHYAVIVKRSALQRSFLGAARQAVTDPDDNKALQVLRKAITDMEADEKGLVSLKDVARAYCDVVLNERAAGRTLVYKTGFPSLDRLGQFGPGQMVVVSARTSHGKTSFMLRMALEMLKTGNRVLYISAEMPGVELMDRLIAMDAQVDLPVIRSRQVGESVNMTKVVTTAAKLSAYPLHIREGGKFNLATIEADLDMVNPQILFLDYLQLVSVPQRVDSRAAFFGDVANGIKALAMQKKILAVVASQFSRDIEKRGADARPTLADLKESSGIEQAADIAMAIHLQMEPKRSADTGDLLVLKNRNGPLMEFPLRFQKRITRFDEMERSDEPGI